MMREMQTALQQLPWNELTPATQTKIKNVVSGSPLFHRMPQQKVYADSEIYQFLLRHPDLVIGFWEELGATQLSLREVRENQYVLRETGGTAAAIEVLHRTNDLCIVYARGEYRGPLLAKSYQGDVVLVLRTQYVRDEMNEPMIVCDLETFIQINSLGADMLVKLFFASLSKVADSNFEITVSFASQMSKAASRTPGTLKDTAEEITSVRQEICVEFGDVVDRVAMRFARRNQPASLSTAQRQTQPVARPRKNSQDVALSSDPSEDWRTTPIFEAPQFFYETVRYEGPDELIIPKQVESGHTGDTIPKLPGPMW